MMAMVMRNFSCSTLATGARQFVVHDALEITVFYAGSNIFSFTPMQIVRSASFDGAEMITCSTPLRRCREAFSFDVKRPEDSMMISAPTSPHGMSAGSGFEKTRSSRPSMVTPFALWPMSFGIVPWTESYLSRYARVAEAVRSFTATKSISNFPASAARTTLRPMRPKPFTPTFTIFLLRSSLFVPCAALRRTNNGERTTVLRSITIVVSVEPIRWRDNALELLDQRRLPHEVVYVSCRSAREVAAAIRDMIVRGAPAIGVAAAYGVALAKQQGEDVRAAADELRAARPTAVNLAWAVDRMLRAGGEAPEADAIFREDVEANRRIGRFGAR